MHLSAGEALSAVTEARDRGIPVHAETCPHYLFLTAEEYERPEFEGAKYVMTPPLRDHHHQQQLWRGLKTDDLQVVSTDHCPFCFNEQPYGMKYSKQQGVDDFSKIPNGAPGVETRMPLIFDGAVQQERHVDQPLRRDHLDRACQTVRPVPAQGHDRGRLGRGHRAVRSEGAMDHPRGRTALARRLQAVRRPPGTGRVKKVFLRGQCIVDGENWKGREGMGEYLSRGQSGKI